MKVTLEFDGHEEREDYEDALNGSKYKSQVEDVWQHLFRPRHKHGYNDAELNTLLENDCCDKLMDKLEEIYQRMKSSYEP